MEGDKVSEVPAVEPKTEEPVSEENKKISKK